MDNLKELGLVELNETNLDEINGGALNIAITGLDQLLATITVLVSTLLASVLGSLDGLLGGLLGGEGGILG